MKKFLLAGFFLLLISPDFISGQTPLNSDKAVKILENTLAELKELGFTLATKGEFVGNNFKSSIILIRG